MKNSKNRFHIVALGASAGGLDAFEKFFSNLPSELGMAYVVVPHLDPHHASMMPQLIQKISHMPVWQIEDGMSVEPDQIYIVPPDKDLGIINGQLQLIPKATGAGSRMPIDYFFRALASDAGEFSVGIVLSGMGMDGSLGLRAIKGELGLTMAQDPQTAKYDPMPKSAIDTAQVDYVLPPEKMPEQLENYLRHLSQKSGSQKPSDQKLPDGIQKIFFLLRQQTGHDFSAYKKNTIMRRIERRMNVHQFGKLEEYVDYLQKNPEEADFLFRELLIGVTSFFREAEAFESLKTHVTKVFKTKSRADTFRVWVPGCSSGEEAYSVAMILCECMEETGKDFDVQIFATDIDARAIEKAREGGYPASIEADIGAQRLEKFFTAEENLFRIRSDIREMIIFAEQDLIKHPPFTKLDLICCRNLLIYLESSLQKKLVPIFHYSLKPGGILFLGSSESIGDFTALLEPLDKKWKIFERKSGGDRAHQVLDFPLAYRTPEADTAIQQTKAAGTGTGPGIAQIAEKALMANWVPPSVIINDRGDILYFHGRTGKFLEPSPGRARFNIYEMAREGLKLELTAAIRKAANQEQPVTYRDLRIRANGDTIHIDLTVNPMDIHQGSQKLLMISFAERTPLTAQTADTDDLQDNQTTDERIRELERELQHTKESLQTTIEEMETANEELRSTNEEYQSTNEELQSTNEELETSKEEQQSLNEELSTVNAELQEKIDELTRVNNDMKNLLDSIDLPIIFLDKVLRVKNFTSQASRVINLIPADVGRPVSDISIKLENVSLREIAAGILEDQASREREVRTTEGRWFAMRAAPFRSSENVIDGVMLAFTDITQIKKSRDDAERLATVLRDANDAVIIWDLDGRILTWNRGAQEMYGYTETEAENMHITDLVPEEKKAEFKSFMEEIKEGKDIRSFKTRRRASDGRVLDVWLTVTRIPNESGDTTEIVTTERDLKWLTDNSRTAQ